MQNINLFFKNNKIPINHKIFLVAASGGPDSIALLDMLVKYVKEPSKQIKVAHLDHCLREDSYQESEILKKYCRDNHVQLFEQKWPFELHPSSGIEAAARNYRYAFFKIICNKYQIDYLLTAHHGDDLIENILLKFIRSGNVQEMNSLQEVGAFSNVTILRPLLKWSKNELLKYTVTNNLEYVVDQTNYEDDTLRNRLRHHVVPLLKNENSNLIENANRFLISERNLEGIAENHFNKLKKPELFLGSLRWNYNDLQQLDFQEQKQYLEFIVSEYFSQKVHFSLSAIQEQKNNSKDNINIRFYQNYLYLFTTKLLLNNVNDCFLINLDKVFIWNKRTFLISLNKNKNSQKLIGYFYADKNILLEVGNLQSGQKLYLASGKEIKAKKKFSEKSVPSFLRSQCLTVSSEKKILWLEKTYQFQNFNQNYVCYYIYETL